LLLAAAAMADAMRIAWKLMGSRGDMGAGSTCASSCARRPWLEVAAVRRRPMPFPPPLPLPLPLPDGRDVERDFCGGDADNCCCACCFEGPDDTRSNDGSLVKSK